MSNARFPQPVRNPRTGTARSRPARRMHPRATRRTPRAAALITAIVLLVVLSVVTSVVLPARTAQLSQVTESVLHLRAEAAALSGLHVAIHRLRNDPALAADLSRAIAENDTSLSAPPLITFNGTHGGVNWTVRVWPRASELRLQSTAEAAGSYVTRWARLPVTLP